MLKILTLVLCCLFAQGSVATESALKTVTPFLVNGELPIAHGLGLPKALPAKLLNPGDRQFAWYSELQSNAIDAGAMRNDSNEDLMLDGETGLMGMSLTYAVGQHWEFRLQAEYARHAGGRLDHLINQWHDVFGLSEGDRPLFAQDQLLFRHQSGQRVNVLQRRVNGFRDTMLSVGYQLYVGDHNAAALRVGVNLPTGDANHVLGSDHADGSISIHWAGQNVVYFSALSWHANIGYLHTGDKQLFGLKTQQDVLFSSLGLHWRASEQWQWKAQVDAHTALFDSQIDELSRSAMQLTLGVDYHVAQHKKMPVIEAYFAEDVTVNRAPDFTLGLRTRWRF